ncbi:MAG: hypothetical protein ABI671_08315 [Burkholderiales bacterium]
MSLLSRALRKSIGRLLIGVMLFAQLAVASHACPVLKGAGATAMGSMSKPILVAAADAAAMPPGCEQLDPNAANLCAEHCQQGQQRADTAAAPVVALIPLTFLYLLPLEPEHTLGSGRSFPALDARLDAALEPPHAILHCVFRT